MKHRSQFTNQTNNNDDRHGKNKRNPKKKREQEFRHIPRSVELDDDEVVLADRIGEVGVVKSEDELLRLGLFRENTIERQRKEKEQGKKRNRNPRRHC